MKEIDIKYSKYIINVLLSTYNTSIIDSYRIRRINDMVNVLKKIRNTCDDSYAIHKRSIFGMVNEWRVHNLLYFLHIKRRRTGTVDLNINQSIWAKIAYKQHSVFNFKKIKKNKNKWYFTCIFQLKYLSLHHQNKRICLKEIIYLPQWNQAEVLKCLVLSSLSTS